MLFILGPLLIIFWLSSAWSADIMPEPKSPGKPVPLEKSGPHPLQGPGTPPPSHIDSGIERRPQTIPDPQSAVVPPNVDPKMTIDPETSPPAMEKPETSDSQEQPRKPLTR